MSEEIVRPLSLRQWIGSVLTRHLTQDASPKLSAFSLVHVRNGTQEEEVKNIVIGSKEWEPKDLAITLDQTAATIASGIPGRQQFIVYALFVNGEKEPFMLGKAGETDFGGIGTEGPTEKGHVAQMMRHTEAYARIMAVHTEQVFGKLLRTVEIFGDMNTHLLEENRQVFEAVKTMVLKNAEEKHERQKELLSYERKTALLKKAAALAPAIINQLTGKKILPDSTVADAILDNLAETLTEDQIIALSSILTQEQIAPIIAILAEKAKAKAVNGDPSVVQESK